MRRDCSSIRRQALRDCFTAVGQDIPEVNHLSYIETCTYSMLMEGSQYHRMMTEALINDSLVIPAYGNIPFPPSTEPVTPIAPPSMTEVCTNSETIEIQSSGPSPTYQSSPGPENSPTYQTSPGPENSSTYQSSPGPENSSTYQTSPGPENSSQLETLSHAAALSGQLVVVMATALYLLYSIV